MEDITLGRLKLTFPSGSSVGHIYIDKIYQGQVVKQQGEWRVYLNDRAAVTEEEIEEIKAYCATKL